MTSEEKKFTITDAIGREVSIKNNPRNIIIAGRQTPMLTHFIYLFETAKDRVAAIENRNQTSEDFISLIDKNISKKYLFEKGASVEQISPFDPDVVIMKTAMQKSVGLQLEEINIPVVYVNFESVEDFYRDISIIGEVMGESVRGNWLISEYEKMYDETKGLLDRQENQELPSVLLIQVEKNDGTFVYSVPDSNWLQTDLVERLDAVPIWKDQTQGGGWSEINFEQIAAWNADYIFVINYQAEAPQIVEEFKKDGLWSKLNAVKSGKMYPFIYDYICWDQPDPRWILAYDWLAYRLYPDLVSAEFVKMQIEYFFTTFYPIDEEQVLSDMKARLSVYFD